MSWATARTARAAPLEGASELPASTSVIVVTSISSVPNQSQRPPAVFHHGEDRGGCWHPRNPQSWPAPYRVVPKAFVSSPSLVIAQQTTTAFVDATERTKPAGCERLLDCLAGGGTIVKRRLVVGVDDTDDSQNALVQATELAEAGNMELLVVHIRHLPAGATLSPTRMRRTVEDLDLIEAATRRAAGDALRATGVEWEFIVRSGDPANELVQVAHDRSARAIVIGGRPHRAAVSVTVGSIDTSLVHLFRRGPVLVVRGDDSAWYWGAEASLSTEASVDAIYLDRPSQYPERD